MAKCYFLLFIVISLLLCNCSDRNLDDGSGIINLTIIDAPYIDKELEGIQISIKSIEIHGPEGWTNYKTFEEPIRLNLFDQDDGTSTFLGEKKMPSGSYSKVKIILEVTKQNDDILTSSLIGSEENSDSSSKNEKVNSGSTFYLPSDGVVNLALSLDINRLVIKKNQEGEISLRPNFKVLVNENFGILDGKFEDIEEYSQIMVVAVEMEHALLFPSPEYNKPSNAIENLKNTLVDDQGNFKFSLLKPGAYHLYFYAMEGEGRPDTLLGNLENIEIQSGQTTVVRVSKELID